jgi:hypothetical protein
MAGILPLFPRRLQLPIPADPAQGNREGNAAKRQTGIVPGKVLENAEYQEPTPEVTAEGKYIAEFVETAMARAKDYGIDVDPI